MMDKPDDLTGLVDAIDDVSELVYVADPETHDLLYMNRAGKTALNIDSLEGLKCYKVIELQDAPVRFAPISISEQMKPIAGKQLTLLLAVIIF